MNCAVAILIVATHGTGMRVYLKINGKTHSLWRVVDQDGNVLDILVQSRCNTKAAKRFFRKLRVRLQYIPRVIITDKLKSYGVAKREILSGVEHRQHARARASERKTPTNPCDCVKKRCGASSQAVQAQRFLSAFGPILNHFRLKRHRLPAKDYRALMQVRFQVWNQMTSRTTAA